MSKTELPKPVSTGIQKTVGSLIQELEAAVKKYQEAFPDGAPGIATGMDLPVQIDVWKGREYGGFTGEFDTRLFFPESGGAVAILNPKI